MPKARVSSVSLNNFDRLVRQAFFKTDFMTITNDVTVPRAVANLTLVGVTSSYVRYGWTRLPL